MVLAHIDNSILLVTAPLTLEDSPSRILGEYVVVLKEGIENEKGMLKAVLSI